LTAHARRTIVSWLVGLSAAAAVGAQPRIIRGTVVDGANVPLPTAGVLVAGVGSTVTDDSGRFRLEIPHKGKVVLDVRHIGYMPSRFGLTPGGDTTVSVFLLARTPMLEAIEIQSSRLKPPTLAGFEERMAARKRGAGVAHFITAADIEPLHASRASQLLETVPSIQVQRVDAKGQRFGIFGRSPKGGLCPATIYLDAVRLGNTDESSVDRRGRSTVRDIGAPVDEYVSPLDIAGIEVYGRGLLAPPQFQAALNQDLACAVVLIWTKFG
jgi:hypothetical protein